MNKIFQLKSKYSATQNSMEFLSSHRNRNVDKIPGNFKVTITNFSSITNNHMIDDPVCTSTPDIAWSSNYFNALGGITLNGTALFQTGIGYSSSQKQFIFVATTTNTIQQEKNYYAGAIINVGGNSVSRIFSSEFIGNDRMIIHLEYYNSNLTNGISLSISDPTDFSDSTAPLIFVPTTNSIENYFIGKYLYNETRGEYRIIQCFNQDSHIIMLNTFKDNSFIPVTTWTSKDNYCIRTSFPSLISSTVSNLSTTSILLTTASTFENINNGDFIRVTAQVYGNAVVAPETEMRRIVSFNPLTNIATVTPPFSVAPNINNILEVLPFTYENATSFLFGVGNELNVQMHYYELSLDSLILPNVPLKSTYGGKIYQYPFVYVEIKNICIVGSGNKNTIYSNNPFIQNQIFRVSISNINEPKEAKFLLLKSDNSPTIFFKPNDTIEISVKFPDGKTFETIEEENYSPAAPNHNIQISALLSFRKINPEV